MCDGAASNIRGTDDFSEISIEICTGGDTSEEIDSGRGAAEHDEAVLRRDIRTCKVENIVHLGEWIFNGENGHRE